MSRSAKESKESEIVHNLIVSVSTNAKIPGLAEAPPMTSNTLGERLTDSIRRGTIFAANIHGVLPCNVQSHDSANNCIWGTSAYSQYYAAKNRPVRGATIHNALT